MKSPLVSSADSSRIVPVATMPKVHATFIAANRNIIAYSSSKKGMVRVICQEDASRLILDTCSYGEILGMALASYGETCILAVACGSGVLLWTLPHSKLNAADVGTNASRVIPIHDMTVITHIAFEPGSHNLVLSCTHTGEGDAEIYVIDVARQDDVSIVLTRKFPLPIVKFDFFPADISRIAVLLSNGHILAWNRDASPDSVPVPLVSSSLDVGTLIGIECLSSNALAAIGENGIAILADGKLVDSMNIEGTVCNSAYFAPYLVVVTKRERILLVTIENNAIAAAAFLQVKLSIHDLCLTENLGRESAVAFEAYLFHNTGVSILSVVKSDLPRKAISSSPKPSKKDDKKRRAAASKEPANHSLAETFSRSQFQEKTYSLVDIVNSGLFVTKQAFDEAERAHRAEIRKLESKIDKLADLVKSRKKNPPKNLEKNLDLTDEDVFPTIVSKNTSLQDSLEFPALQRESIDTAQENPEKEPEKEPEQKPAPTWVPVQKPNLFCQQVASLVSACENKSPLAPLVDNFLSTCSVSDLDSVAKDEPMLLLSALAVLSLALTNDNNASLVPWFDALAQSINPANLKDSKGLIVSVLNKVKNNIRPYSSMASCVQAIQTIILDAY